MSWTDRDHPLWTRLLWLCAAATALPLWVAGHLPFTDLPQHVAAISTLRHWWDPAFKVQEHFTLALGQTQYLLYYLAGALLAFPFGTAERANLVLLTLTALAFPLSLRSLLRALKADERLALFAAPLFWSQALLIGFFNYVAAMPLCLWGLSLAVREAEDPSLRKKLALGALALAIFYLHLSAFVFWAPAAAAALWLLPVPPPSPAPPPSRPAFASVLLQRLPRLPLRLLWALPVTLAALQFLFTSPVVRPKSIGWTQSMVPVFEDPGSALRNLTDALLDIWRGPEDEWVLLGLLAACALIAWPQSREVEDEGTTLRRSLAAVWLAWAALLYFLFPRSIGWMWQLNERYALVFALLVPALLRPVKGLKGAAPLVLVGALTLFGAGVEARNVRIFEAEVGPFDRVLAQAEPGKHLLSMILEQNSSVAKFSAFLHFGSYYRARQGGVASFSFAELPQSPFHYRPESAPPVKRPGWEWHAYDFDNAREGPYYDYLLVHGNIDPRAQFSQGAGPKWRLVVREERWGLWGKVP